MQSTITVPQALKVIQDALAEAKAIENVLGLNGHAPKLTLTSTTTGTSGSYAPTTFTQADKPTRPYKRTTAGRARQIAAMKLYWAKRRASKKKAKR